MKQINEETRKALLEYHFYYECIQLFNCIVEVRKSNPDESRILIPNYLAVAFSTHARNLWEFFYGSNNKPLKRSHVKHYIENWNIVASPYMKKYHGLLNKQLSHLDYGRTKTKEPSPIAFIYQAYREFRSLVKEFLDKLPKEILGPNLERLKKIIGDDISNYP